MTINKKIKLLQKLLEERYTAEVYDTAEKTSIFRLRAERVIAKMYKLESEAIYHE